MTVDPTDYAPRPADDFVSRIDLVAKQSKRNGWLVLPLVPMDLMPRYFSIIKFKPFECHQLGCNFDELPHG